MRKYEFKAESVVHGHGQNAMRGAVLGSVFSGKVFSSTSVPDLVQKLRELWRARLTSLCEAGWGPADTMRKFAYLQNCPPFGIRTDDTANNCGWRRFCPFCWARDITASLYDRVVASCYQSDRKTVRPVKVVLYRRMFPESRTITRPDLILSTLSLLHREEIKLYPELCGAFVLHAVEPYEHIYRFHRRVLLVLPEDTRVRNPIAKDPRSEYTTWSVPDCSLENLRRVVVSATKYPRRLLRCQADDLMDYLDITKNIRMTSYLGSLRNTKGFHD